MKPQASSQPGASSVLMHDRQHTVDGFMKSTLHTLLGFSGDCTTIPDSINWMAYSGTWTGGCLLFSQMSITSENYYASIQHETLPGKYLPLSFRYYRCSVLLRAWWIHIHRLLLLFLDVDSGQLILRQLFFAVKSGVSYTRPLFIAAKRPSRCMRPFFCRVEGNNGFASNNFGTQIRHLAVHVQMH